MKSKAVGAFEAKTHLSALLDDVEKGTVVYITRHGKRVAELRPVQRAARPHFGSARGTNFRLGKDFDETPDDFKDYVG